MIVVSDTSPLTNLAAIGQFDLLHRLFGEIYIANGVWRELNFGGRPHPGSREVETADWIHHREVRDQALVAALRRDLDLGEAETLALAVELEASVVLIDEREGRRTVIRLGLHPLGVLGLLLEAKKKGLVEEIRSSLKALRHQAGFYISNELYRSVLDMANEAP